MGDVAKEDAKAEILKRIKRYKKAPTLNALRRRLSRYCGGDQSVEELVRELMKENLLRCTNKVFHLPSRFSEPNHWDA